MSFFPDMFKRAPENKIRTFVLHVNDQGDCVIYQAEPDGSTKTFVTGRVIDVLGASMAKIAPGHRIVELGPRRKDDQSPSSYGLDHGTWAGFKKAYDGKGLAAGRLRERFFLLKRHQVHVPYISYDGYEKITVTEAGLAWDAARAEKLKHEQKTE